MYVLVSIRRSYVIVLSILIQKSTFCFKFELLGEQPYWFAFMIYTDEDQKRLARDIVGTLIATHSALLMASLIQTSGHKMVALTVVFLRLSGVDSFTSRNINQVKYCSVCVCVCVCVWFHSCLKKKKKRGRDSSSLRFSFNISLVLPCGRSVRVRVCVCVCVCRFVVHRA